MLREYIESIGMEKRIFLLRYQKGIPQILKSCDRFIFTSFREGLPGTLMKAMAAGLSCIVSCIRGNTDALEDSAFMFEPTDDDELVKLMEKCLKLEFVRKNPRRIRNV